MDFGNEMQLQHLAGFVRDSAERTRHCLRSAQQRIDDMTTSADQYERGAMTALSDSWAEAARVGGWTASTADVVADGIDTFARTAEECEQRWTSTRAAAVNSGFVVNGDGPTVSVSASTTAPLDQVGQAARLQADLRGAASDMVTAQRTLRRLLDTERVRGLSLLEPERGQVPYADTGDCSLDTELTTYLAPLAGAFEMFTPSRRHSQEQR